MKRNTESAYETACVGRAVPIESITLTDKTPYLWRGRRTALVFYPADFTPMSARQWRALRDRCGARDDLTIIGVSQDSPARHADFKAAYDLPFLWADDADGRLARVFGMLTPWQGRAHGYALVDSAGVLTRAKKWTVGADATAVPAF